MVPGAARIFFAGQGDGGAGGTGESMTDYRKTIADRIKSGGKVALYCYGIYASHMLRYLEKFHGALPAVVIDNDPRKRGFAEFGIPVVPFAEAREKYGDMTYFICSNDYKYAIMGDLLETGVKSESIINCCSVEKSNGCFYNVNQINLFNYHGEFSFSNCSLDNCHSGFDRHVGIDGNDDFAEKLDAYISDFRAGKVSECDSCELKYSQYLRNDGKFDVVRGIQNRWDDCSLNCVFCSSKAPEARRAGPKKEIVKFDRSDYKKYLEKFFCLRRFDENPIVRIVLSESNFEKRLATFCEVLNDHKIPAHIFDVFSCFSVYSKTFAGLLSEGICVVIWSLDAGNRETFLKIKQVDAFDKVIANAKKYIEKSVFGAKFIIAKYMIVKGVNDSKAEFDGFLRLVRGLGVENIALDWDFAVPASAGDDRFIRECYDTILLNNMKLQYKNINRVISEALNLNFLLRQGALNEDAGPTGPKLTAAGRAPSGRSNIESGGK
jgi:hypothetical protein